MKEETNNSTQAVQVVEQTPAERVMKLEGEGRDEWLKTGKLPELEQTKEEVVTSATPAKEAETQDSSKKQERTPKPSRRDQRILELLNENKRLSDEVAKSKAGPKTEEKQLEKVVEPAKKVEAEGKPILGDFATYEEWVEAVTDWKADQRINQRFEEERKARETSAKESELAKANKEIEKSWMERVDKAKEKYADYEDVAFSKEATKEIKPGSVLDSWLLDSDYGAEMLYHFASNPEEIIRLNSLTAFAQARELTKLESKFEEKAPEKKVAVTKAPKPPAEVSGNGTVSEDPVDGALKAKNFSAYQREQNARELKSQRG